LLTHLKESLQRWSARKDGDRREPNELAQKDSAKQMVALRSLRRISRNVVGLPIVVLVLGIPHRSTGGCDAVEILPMSKPKAGEERVLIAELEAQIVEATWWAEEGLDLENYISPGEVENRLNFLRNNLAELKAGASALAAPQPDKVRELIAKWRERADKCHNYPTWSTQYRKSGHRCDGERDCADELEAALGSGR
jgi:hypothetical protein